MISLENLAGDKFGSLTEAELQMLRVALTKEIAWCGPSTEKNARANDPFGAGYWPTSRHIRAEIVVWLVTDDAVRNRVHPSGIGIGGARIVGKLALENQKLTGPLTLFRCWVPEGISLYYAECTYVDFRGCTTGSIDARRLIVKGDILFSDSFVGVGEINLSGAEIGGDLQCQGAWFINPGGVAMLADSIKVGRNLRLGSPSADDATVLDKQSHFRADGEICLDGAIVGEQLDCFAGHFRNRGAVALSANAAEIGGDVQLSGSFCSLGEVHFVGCEVGGQFDCEGGHFLNHRDTALTLNGARIHRDVILRDGFRAYGEVNLLGVEIDGDIDCSRASFFGAGRTALMAAGASIKQRLLLRRDFRATGEVNIDGARVGADLDCSNGNFFQSSTFALSAVATTITGSASLESVEAKGLLVLRRAKIGGDLSLAGARFTGDQPNGLDARTAEIGGTLT